MYGLKPVLFKLHFDSPGLTVAKQGSCFPRSQKRNMGHPWSCWMTGLTRTRVAPTIRRGCLRGR